MKNARNQQQPMIGQAWTGKHVILLHCNERNQFKQLYSSYHAPIEPPRQNCAETLSQLFSIGYKVKQVTNLTKGQLQYLLVL
ncbi:hypothetical protein [Metabacillus endolithicus]|uniref:Uncharacterized protein n=1 Tax=Metabacillus endolithicus TaxID=1535204 RepID=A0ABW5C081_9BACI|nr:hypothetical protein [Metabacillus endolithicus]UPG64236.1 hypothetical protein MVE64_03660 [Metabacillus endolithicus]